jgi:hypothetical protein
MKYEGVGFTDEWVLSQSENEFIDNAANGHLWPGISEEARKQRLKEVYQLISYANDQQLDASEPEGGFAD